MKSFIITFILVVTLQISYSQHLYYSSVISTPGSDTNRIEIGYFDLITCEAHEVSVDTSLDGSGYLEWGDIAMCPDGSVYGLGRDGIYLIDPLSQIYTKIMDPPPPPAQRWEKGLVCTKDSMLIFGERDILTFNLKTQVLINHGRVPASMAIWSNLFWFRGQLMGSANNRIIQIDLQNPAMSTVYCTLPTTGFLSLTEVAISCDSTAIFAFHVSGDVYLVNPVDWSISLYCQIPKYPDETFQGSSPDFMYMTPGPCEIHLDLDESVDGIDYTDSIFCSLPARYIFSYPELFSDKPWDSLKIWIESGPNGVYLDGEIPVFSDLKGKGTNQLSYYSKSTAGFESLSPYINQLLLTGEMPMGISTVKIGFCGWANYLISDTAYAYITLVGRTTTAGSNDSISLCLSDQPLKLSELLSTEANSGGKWIPSVTQINYFNPQTDKSGKYYYIIDDPICNSDTAEFLIKTKPLPNFDLGPDRVLCQGDTIHFEINLPGAYLLWSDGSSGSEIEIVQPQQVSLIITDEFGCVFKDSANVLFDDHCIFDDLYIPNIFSPDGNGINDEWIVAGSPAIKSIALSIFDRWGNMLFQQKGESIYWNGLTRGNKTAPPGVYVYKLEILSANQNIILRTGSVTLLK